MAQCNKLKEPNLNFLAIWDNGDPNTGSIACSISILCILMKNDNYKGFLMPSRSFVENHFSILNEELPDKSIVFVDNANPSVVTKWYERKDEFHFILLVTLEERQRLNRFPIVETPNMNKHSAEEFSRNCLKADFPFDGAPKLSLVKATHNKILQQKKQSFFNFSFTRFISASINPEAHISSQLKSYDPQIVENLRLLALISNLSLSANLFTKETMDQFHKLPNTCPWVYIDDKQILRFWNAQIGTVISYQVHLQNAKSIVQLFFERLADDYEFDPRFWKQKSYCKPSSVLKTLAESVRSKTCYVLLSERVEEAVSSVKEEKKDYLLVHARTLLTIWLTPEWNKQDPHEARIREELRRKCFDVCSKIEDIGHQDFSMTMKGTVLFQTRLANEDRTRLLSSLHATVKATNYHSISQFPCWFNAIAKEMGNNKSSIYSYAQTAIELQCSLIINYPWHEYASTEPLKEIANHFPALRDTSEELRVLVGKQKPRNKLHPNFSFLRHYHEMQQPIPDSASILEEHGTHTLKKKSDIGCTKEELTNSPYILCYSSDRNEYSWKLFGDAIEVPIFSNNGYILHD